MQVSFVLVDLNDNAPHFAVDHSRIYVSEGSLPGASIPLEPALDMDSPANGVAGYRLVDESATCRAPFDLMVERGVDGTVDVQLVLQSPGLDRERCDRYRPVIFL